MTQSALTPRLSVKNGPDPQEFAALATLIQRWSELCKQQVQSEQSPALCWYLWGMANAFEFDAARIRELLDPSTTIRPAMDTSNILKAFKSLMSTMGTVADVREQNHVRTPK